MNITHNFLYFRTRAINRSWKQQRNSYKRSKTISMHRVFNKLTCTICRKRWSTCKCRMIISSNSSGISSKKKCSIIFLHHKLHLLHIYLLPIIEKRSTTIKAEAATSSKQSKIKVFSRFMKTTLISSMKLATLQPSDVQIYYMNLFLFPF